LPDVIALTVPSDPRYGVVARVVVGGLAARLDLSYEALDDLQLAVESVLAAERLPAADELTIEVAVDAGRLELAVGPVPPDAAERELATSADAERGAIGLATILRAVVDGVEVVDRDGGRWLVLVKRVPVSPAV
jgi:anti-sigma regulatory factor (Ser/Thr protein kinase)